MFHRATNPMALRDFRASLHGELILPDDDGYDSARRVWKGMIDNYPALIIRCATRADVTHAVEFGRLQHLPVAVRGGGHSVSGKSVCDEGIVTADGQVKRASATEHPDLFWGVRGGGGNFGIVTAFEFQLHAVGPVLAGKVVYPMSRAREVLCFYREYTSSVPDELTAYASLMTTPDGLPAIAINLCFCGSLDAGERLVEPVRKFGPPSSI
jgi:FAD/FMN-containing dehydrogenase